MFWRITGILAVSIGLAFVMLYPMFYAEKDRQPTGDATVMVWNIWHSTESVLSGQSPLITDLWLWPNGVNLGKHTLSPGFFPIGVVTKMLTRNDLFWPFYAYRAVVFTSFVLMFSLMYWFLRGLTCRPASSMIISGVFTYCDFLLSSAQHPQFPAMLFFPLISILLLRLWKIPSNKRLLAMAVAIAISVYFTEMVVFWLIGLAIVFVLYSTTQIGRLNIRRVVSQISISGWLLAGGSAILLATPFLLAFSQVDEVSLSETAKVLSADLNDLFLPDERFSPLWFYILDGFLNLDNGGFSNVSLGYVIPLLATVSFWLVENQYRSLILFISITSIFFLIMSLGPELGLYNYLAKVPPFTTFRVPYRLAFPALFLLAIPAALTLSRISQKKKIGKWAIGIFCILAFTEVCVFHERIREGHLSGYSLYKIFATPSRDFAETLTESGKPGAWATLPPKFQDTSGVLAQIFHQQPIFASCWMSRWEKGQTKDYYDFREAYRQSFFRRQENGPEYLALWLKSRGVENVLLTGGRFDEQTIEKLRQSINVVDAQDIFTVEYHPFRDIFPRDMITQMNSLELEIQ